MGKKRKKGKKNVGHFKKKIVCLRKCFISWDAMPFDV
jgi:hypothetical protein